MRRTMQRRVSNGDASQYVDRTMTMGPQREPRDRTVHDGRIVSTDGRLASCANQADAFWNLALLLELRDPCAKSLQLALVTWRNTIEILHHGGIGGLHPRQNRRVMHTVLGGQR